MPACAFTLLAVALVTSRPLGPGDHVRSMEIDKLKRNYLIHVPTQYDPAKPTPLVIALHGATMTAKIMEGFSGLDKKADQAGFIVVYPNGTGPSLLQTWNSGGFAPILARNKPDDVTFIACMLDDLERMLNVDKKKIYATGISNGGMMCYRLAAELSDRIAAIAPVAGTIALENYEPKRPVPVLHIHGTADGLVPFEGPTPKTTWVLNFRSVSDTMAACIKCNGCALIPKSAALPMTRDAHKITRKIHEAPAGGAEVILYVVDGGGHTWPGRPVGGGILGPYTMNLDANDVIWEFFKRHELK